MATPVATRMYRAILPDGDITCSDYDQTDEGVEIFTENNDLIAFIPYPNLVAITNEDIEREQERSIM